MNTKIATRRFGDGSDDIDLTPMLDVVFIMLIFFVVTATFVMEQGIDVQRPEPSPAQTSDTTPLVLTVTASGEIWLKERRIDKLSVRSNVARILAEDPARAVVVSAALKAPTSAFVPVLDSARQAGAQSVSLQTVPTTEF